MKHGPAANATYQPMPRLWRIILIALATAILCSCRGPGESGYPPGVSPGVPPTLPPQAFSGTPAGMSAPAGPGVVAPQAIPHGVPMSYAGYAPAPVPADVTGPWAPPGIPQPWPPDEYLVDGGDQGQRATVKPDWEVRGLELQDTIAHYDTLDGRTVVEPSNRVHIYSPRFGAVRQLVSLRQNQQRNRSSAVHQPVRLGRSAEIVGARTSKQNTAAERHVVNDLAAVFQSRQGDGLLSSRLGPLGFQQDYFKPYENLSAIRTGRFDAAQMAFLTRGATAAIAWSHEHAVQVILDNQTAAVEISDRNVEMLFTVQEPPAHPKLRVMKVASTPSAAPGDSVDFTIRFDNVGNQVIGNVTIIDNLTTRLEYEPDSAQSNKPANFLTERNEGDSLVLRWEIIDPLPPGDGGIIRFRCRVR